MSGRTAIVTLLVACLVVPALSHAQDRVKKRTLNVAVERRSGDKVRGPAQVTVTGVNVLRYDVRLGVTVTFPSAPDMKVPFIPPVVGPAGAESGQRGMEVARSLGPAGSSIADILDRLAQLEVARLTNVYRPVEDAVSSLNRAKLDLDALVAGSDAVLPLPKGPERLVDQSGSMATAITAAIEKPWPTTVVATQLSTLAGVRSDFAKLPPRTDQNRAAYESSEQQIATLMSWYQSVAADGSITKAADATRSKLNGWLSVLTAIKTSGTSAFTLPPFLADCGFSFLTGKESKLELVRRDRLADPAAQEAREELLTVVCSSPVSVSAGFGVSNIETHNYKFVPAVKTTEADGKTTTVAITRIGEEISKSHTAAMVALNVRLWEPTDWFSVQVSAGAAVDNKGGEVGVNIERFVGPTVAFWRTFFVTFGGKKLGHYWGYNPRLGGGFAVDDEVPSGISAPPILNDSAGGAFVAFTYRIH